MDAGTEFSTELAWLRDWEVIITIIIIIIIVLLVVIIIIMILYCTSSSPSTATTTTTTSTSSSAATTTTTSRRRRRNPKLHVSEKIPGLWTLFSNWHATCFKSEVTMRLRVYLLSFPSGRSFSWAKKTGFFRWNLAVFRPWKIHMEPKHGGLVDGFSFPNGWFLSSMLVF